MKSHRSDQTQVLDAQIYELNLEEDSIYYTLESQGLTVSRFDGSGVAPALDFSAGNVQIAGDWIYTHGPMAVSNAFFWTRVEKN